MKKLVAILGGDPVSINSELIAKTWKKKNSFKNLNIVLLGNYLLFKKQFTKIGIKIKIKKIDNLENINFKKNLNIYDIPLKFNNPFKISIKNKKKYIEKSFQLAIDLIKKREIHGLINCPINKSEMSNYKKFTGVTEFLAKKEGVLGNEVMLIYNKELSVSPITTHTKLKSVPKKISKNKIVNKILAINNFFNKKLNTKPKIGILGLNPHNDELRSDSEEKKIIIPAINLLKKKKIYVSGPISPDTAFMQYKNKGFNVLVGMYHDQVLSPFKSIYKFNAINVTLGLPYIRVSPDHGTGRDIVKKNKANPQSLIECLNFFKRVHVEI